jgi:hypothetical protein
LNKALVWGTDTILHKLQKGGVTIPNISLKCVQNWFWPNMATPLPI